MCVLFDVCCEVVCRVCCEMSEERIAAHDRVEEVSKATAETRDALDEWEDKNAKLQVLTISAPDIKDTSHATYSCRRGRLWEVVLSSYEERPA